MSSLNERNKLLGQLADLHNKWQAEMADKVEFNPDRDSAPHNAETGESDYSIHYMDRGASPEQEQAYQDSVAGILEQLANLGEETPEEFADKMSKVSDTVDFNLAVNGDAVQMLTKHDFEEGMLSYRQGGEWVPIQPEDDLPALDEADLLEVTGDATEIWDSKEGGELTLSDFSSTLLDEG